MSVDHSLMDHKCQSIFKVDTRKLLWLLAISFALVLSVQYIELPQGNVLSLLFSAHKAPLAGKDVILNVGDKNSTGVPSSKEIFDDNYYSDGNSSISSKDTLSKDHSRLNVSSEVDDYGVEDYLVAHDSVSVHKVNHSTGGYATEKSMESDAGFTPLEANATVDSGSSLGDLTSPVLLEHRDMDESPSPAPVLPPSVLSQNITLTNKDNNITSPFVSTVSNNPSLGKGLKPGVLRDEDSRSAESSAASSIHREEKPQTPAPAVITISEMNRLLDQSITTYRSMKPRWSSKVDQELVSKKLKILSAPIVINDPALYSPLYRNISMFRRSYELMEETLKVYIYKEGQKPIFHQPPLKGIYASEGWFMKQMKASKKFVTKDARNAHLFYLPFSSRMLEEALYVPNSHSHRNLVGFLKNYLDLIGAKYPFWNRTGGADHFLVACHDWAPGETKRIMSRCIRSLCNSDVKDGFVFGKDASLPETFVQNPQRPLRELGGNPPSKRSILAFFAGNMHGYLRPLLLQHWGNNIDRDMRIFAQLPKVKGTMTYAQHMKSSKYCICAKGYEVNSPRVVEAIFYECVPVIISDNFVPPFFEVLNWESFAVFVLEKNIPNLKNILLSIPEQRYREMQMRVKKVQQHFLWHPKPVRYDIFHMILHSLWYNRVLHVNPR